MLNCIMNIAVCGLAASAVLRVWLHPGGIFENTREKLRTRLYSEGNVWVLPGIRYKLLQLIDCQFCLSYWAAGLVLLFLIGVRTIGGWSAYIGELLIIMAATSRFVHLLDKISLFTKEE